MTGSTEPTIRETLKEKLGREPTLSEINEEVNRIMHDFHLKTKKRKAK